MTRPLDVRLLALLCAMPCFSQMAPATAKADAKYYLFGSALFGVGTKPLYILDMKIDADKEVWTNKFLGLNATFSANTTSEAPVDKPDIDPDSITASTTFRTSKKFGKTNWHVDWATLKGEFSRKTTSSNLLTSPSLRWSWEPWCAGAGRLVFYPVVGMELGHNLNRPSTLFKRPVDLSNWRGISRIRTGAQAAWYLIAQPPTPTRVYSLVVDASWETRTPLTDEPWVRSAYLPNDKGDFVRQKVTFLRRNARHVVDAGFSWHVSPLFAIRTQYHWGALPPFFEFVNHQVTFGLVFKAK